MPPTLEQRIAEIERWIVSQRFHRHEWPNSIVGAPTDLGAGIYEPIGTAATAVSSHESSYGHLSSVQLTDLTDGGSTSLHSHAGGGGGILYDTQANRPAANSVADGTLFVPTDGYHPSISNAVTWDVYPFPGFKATNPPAAGTFTKVGGGAETTLVADGDGLLFTMMGLNSTSLTDVAYLTALPAAPYSFVMGMNVLNLRVANYMQVGICLSNGTSATDEFTDLIYQNDSGGVPLFMCQKFSAIDTWVAHYDSRKTTLWTTVFLRFRDDNTNRYYEWSVDGRNYQLLYSVGRTDYLTPTHGGLWISQGTTAVPVTMTAAQAKIFHWSLA